MWNKEEMCKMAAELELKDGMYVNLGIGIPTLVANYVPHNIHVMFQSENGMLGMGPFPYVGEEDPDLINAGKQTIAALPESSYFDSAASFAMIRGGHIDLTILGSLQVDEKGSLANWTIPGKMVKGMGGAMDLVSGAKRVVIIMEHTSGEKPKLVKECEFPLTGIEVVNRLITDLGIFDFESGKLILKKLAPNVSVEEIKAKSSANFIVDL